MKLYELANEYQRMVDLAATCDDPADLSAYRDTAEALTGEIGERLENLAKVVRTIEAEADGVDEEIKRLTARKKAHQNAVGNLKHFMQATMERANMEKHKGELFTLAIQNNPPAVVVDDQAKLPTAFIEMVPKVLVSVISQTLKAGEDVPGAHLERTRSLRIR